MKKLLLITFLFLITPQAKADMDKLCDVTRIQFPKSYLDVGDAIKKLGCERDNILVVFEGRNFDSIQRTYTIASYCRFDRNVAETPNGFTCVLYSRKGRSQV